MGQDIDSLKEEIRVAEETIRKNNLLLESNKGRQQNSATQLSLTRSTIQNRKSIIANLDKQISIIKRNISSNNSSVKKLNSSVVEARKDFEKVIVNSYKNYKSNSNIIFIFSSNNIHEMLKRIFYLKRHSAERALKTKKLISTTTTITNKNERLKEQKEELDNTIKDRNKELSQLASEEKEQNYIISRLKNEESIIFKEIKNKQDVINKLSARITEIMEEEARKNDNLTSEQESERIVLTGDFEQNRGKMPIPVKGVITDKFGVHTHPTETNLKINNKGINISITSNSAIRSIFSGVVSKVFSFQGFNNVVMIRHGDYISVYSNLDNVTVKAGDKVGIGEKIGNIIYDNSGNKSFHFELWQNKTPLNPELWLKAK